MKEKPSVLRSAEEGKERTGFSWSQEGRKVMARLNGLLVETEARPQVRSYSDQQVEEEGTPVADGEMSFQERTVWWQGYGHLKAVELWASPGFPNFQKQV